MKKKAKKQNKPRLSNNKQRVKELEEFLRLLNEAEAL